MPAGVTSAWEENNQPWPGLCPDLFVRDQIYTWKYVPGFLFGGINGASKKTLDTVVTTMGLRTTSDAAAMQRWLDYGHLESFYFTQLYGLARWDAWVPAERLHKDGRSPL